MPIDPNHCFHKGQYLSNWRSRPAEKTLADGSNGWTHQQGALVFGIIQKRTMTTRIESHGDDWGSPMTLETFMESCVIWKLASGRNLPCASMNDLWIDHPSRFQHGKHAQVHWCCFFLVVILHTHPAHQHFFVCFVHHPQMLVVYGMGWIPHIVKCS